ncbi:MAG: L-2-amino-thiazoline-4-carboxylic acid hydrolase [Promethearchaeota archaeon]
MEELPNEALPTNQIEAQGMMIKSFYRKFGKEALPLIKEVCRKQGRALGLKIKTKLSDTKLSTVAMAFSKSFDQRYVTVISVSDNEFHIQGTKCPFGLENTSRELCETVMEIDHEYFRVAVNNNIKLEILNTVAEGDSCCNTIYKI